MDIRDVRMTYAYKGRMFIRDVWKGRMVIRDVWI